MKYVIRDISETHVHCTVGWSDLAFLQFSKLDSLCCPSGIFVEVSILKYHQVSIQKYHQVSIPKYLQVSIPKYHQVFIPKNRQVW